MPRRVLPTSNLALYHAGEGEAVIAGERIRIAPGSLVLTPRGWTQAVRHDRRRPYHASAVHAHLPVFGGARDLFAVLGFPRHLRLDPIRDAVAIAALVELPRLDALHPPGWLARAQAQLTLIIHHLIAAHGSAFDAGGPLPVDRDATRLAPALERIERELGRPLRVAVLADDTGLGAVAFRQLMHRVTGSSPIRYLQDRRIERACLLLAQSNAPLTEVAAAVGMRDAAAFSRLFRTRTGQAPGHWRSARDRP